MSTIDATISVEVVLALPARQVLRKLTLTEGAVVAEAIEQAKISSALAERMADAPRVGIHGKVVTPDHVLRDGDRVEIYRPLTLDPMQARRRRARAGLNRGSVTVASRRLAVQSGPVPKPPLGFSSLALRILSPFFSSTE